MQNRKLAELARALREAEIPPPFEPDESRCLIYVLRRVAAGRPVSEGQLNQIASDLHMPVEGAISLIGQVSERDKAGNVVGILGLSQKDHPHRFAVNGRSLATWCAWDTLFLPGLLKQRAKVESLCPATRKKIRVELTPNQVERWEPLEAALSLVVPEVSKRGRESVEEIWTTFCCFVHFFTSPAAASDWFAGRRHGARILSVEEGYELGRMAFADLREYA